MDTLDHDHAVAASPTRFDFLFVKPGARWQNLRQQTIWDRGLLGRLAMEYGNQASDFDKRSLVERFVVLVVSKGGRFLRSHDEKKNIAWVVVRDKNAIVRDLMRVLRQMKKRINHEERQIVNELKENDPNATRTAGIHFKDPWKGQGAPPHTCGTNRDTTNERHDLCG